MTRIFAMTAAIALSASTAVLADGHNDWDEDGDGMMSAEEGGNAYPSLTLAEWNERDTDKDGQWNEDEMAANSDEDNARWSEDSDED